jgi:hypothetical protein
MSRVFALLLTLWNVGISASAFALALPGGKAQYEFVDIKGDPTRSATVWMFVPGGCDTKCALQSVMHGVKRSREEYLDNWVDFAKESKFTVITPEYVRKYFPKDSDYSLGRSTIETDANNEWAFAVPEHLFDELKSRNGFTAPTYRMFGHSAGGQFVHPMHFFYAEHRVSLIIAANPGWYMQWHWGLVSLDGTQYKFPYTTIDSKIDEAHAKKAWSRSFALLLSDKAIDPYDENRNRSACANAQGKFRLERGENFMQNARAAAKRLNVASHWQSHIVPRVAKDNAGMARSAIALMYAESKPNEKVITE